MGIPITGSLQAVWNKAINGTATTTSVYNMEDGKNFKAGLTSAHFFSMAGGNSARMNAAVNDTTNARVEHKHDVVIAPTELNKNTIEIKNAATILLSQLNEMLAIESMHLVNAIAGIRDDEFLSAHWGISPSNEALQYPIIFGRSSMNLITETVFQTAQNAKGSGVGDMWGKGSAVGESGQSVFHAKEFSIYMKLMYIKPNTTYGGQGIVRSKTQNTMYDFPFVELNHLALQPVYAAELLCASEYKPKSTDKGITIIKGDRDTTAETYNNRVLGFATNYSWYTEKRDKVSGLFIQEQYYDETDKLQTKENLYNWTEARFFSIDSGTRPIINNSFLQVKLDNRNYQVVDNTIERAQFLVWHNNVVNVWRSLSAKRLPSMLGITQGLK